MFGAMYGEKAKVGDTVLANGTRYRVTNVRINFYDVVMLDDESVHGLLRTKDCVLVRDEPSEEEYLLK